MSRAFTVGAAIALAMTLMAGGALAKNQCISDCAKSKTAGLKAVKDNFKACKSAAADAAAKKACKDTMKGDKKAVLDVFKSLRTQCKADKTATLCNPSSPLGAFVAG